MAASSLWSALALRVRDAEALQSVGGLVVFVLLFLSSSLATVTSFPGWLQPVVRANPLSAVVDGLAALAAGRPWTVDVGVAALVLATLLVVALVAVRRAWGRLGR